MNTHYILYDGPFRFVNTDNETWNQMCEYLVYILITSLAAMRTGAPKVFREFACIHLSLVLICRRPACDLVAVWKTDNVRRPVQWIAGASAMDRQRTQIGAKCKWIGPIFNSFISYISKIELLRHT